MKTLYKLSQSVAVLMSIFAIIASPLSANAAVFAKFEGVDGESKDDRHEGWIDVLSTDWGAARSIVSGRSSGPKSEPFVIRCDFDKASPKLQEKLWKGEIIPKLTVEYTATYGGARETYMKIEMEKVSIASFKFDGVDGEAAERPMMGISLNFEKIKVTYTEYDDAGRKIGDTTYSYTLPTGI